MNQMIKIWKYINQMIWLIWLIQYDLVNIKIYSDIC